MEYVNFGKTGMKVSRLCLGMMTYGSKKWREWVLEEEEARPFIKRALDAGINFFDTADVYSTGASEEVLGRTLRYLKTRREDMVIATKVCNPMSDDPNDRGLSRKHILTCQLDLRVTPDQISQLGTGILGDRNNGPGDRNRIGLRNFSNDFAHAEAAFEVQRSALLGLLAHVRALGPDARVERSGLDQHNLDPERLHFQAQRLAPSFERVLRRGVAAQGC